MAGKQVGHLRPGAGAGRPSDLTQEVIDDVKRLLPIVLYVETVANYIGIDRVQFWRWLKRGGKEHKRLTKDPNAEVIESERLYLEFRNAIKKAEAEGEIYDLGVIKAASATHWQAAAWRQERRHNDRWGSDKQAISDLKKQVADLMEIVQALHASSQATSPTGKKSKEKG